MSAWSRGVKNPFSMDCSYALSCMGRRVFHAIA